MNSVPIQLVLHPLRDVEYLRERRAFSRIEIDRPVVLAQRIGHARETRILRDGRELRHVQERRERAADQRIAWSLLADRLDVFGQHFTPHARGVFSGCR
jgi:hypothetical protein